VVPPSPFARKEPAGIDSLSQRHYARRFHFMLFAQSVYRIYGRGRRTSRHVKIRSVYRITTCLAPDFVAALRERAGQPLS
jgi:hypothetical protein